MSTDLHHKVALVTGSTSGIGLGIAQALASQGAHVVLNGFGDPEQIEVQRRELQDQHNVRVMYLPSDLTKPEQIHEMIHVVERELGPVEIVVNNAGVQYVAPVDEFPDEKWDLILALNLSSAFHVVKGVLPHMKKKGWGRIINIASAHGLVASPFKSAYVAAKHGLVGFTKSLALELGETHITCNAICPGYVKTQLVENQIAEQARAHNMSPERVAREVLLAAHAKKEFVQVEQVAQLVLFLCSPAASMMTGASLTMDGGWTAR